MLTAQSYPRIVLVTIVVAAAAFSAALAAYAFRFGPPWQLSGNGVEWAEFGEYLGGLLGPWLSLLGMVLVALGLFLQLEQYRVLSAEASAASARWHDELQQERFFRILEHHSVLVERIHTLHTGRTGVAEDTFSRVLEYVRSDAFHLEVAALGPTWPVDGYRNVRGRVAYLQVMAPQLLSAVNAMGRIASAGEDASRPMYEDLVRSAVSDDELLVLWLEAEDSGMHGVRGDLADTALYTRARALMDRLARSKGRDA